MGPMEMRGFRRQVLGKLHQYEGHLLKLEGQPNDSFAFTQCYASIGDPDGEDFAFTRNLDPGRNQSPFQTLYFFHGAFGHRHCILALTLGNGERDRP